MTRFHLKESSEVERCTRTACLRSPIAYPLAVALVCYFLLAFGFSWLMFLPGLLMYYGVLSLSPQAVRWLAIAGFARTNLVGIYHDGRN